MSIKGTSFRRDARLEVVDTPHLSTTRPSPAGQNEPSAAHESLERAAWVDLVNALPPERRRALGLEARDIDGATALICSRMPHLLVNRALGLGTAAPVTEARLDAVVAAYRAAGVDRYFLHLPQGIEDSPASRWLTARGLQIYHRSWVKLAREGDTAPPCPSGIRVVEAETASAEVFGEILGAGFDMSPELFALWSGAVGRPGWHGFLALVDERPAAAGALFVHGRHGYLAGGATVPALRGRGAQTALIAARVERALAVGCRVLSSETGEAVAGEPNHSFDNLVRAGFRPIYIRPNYVPSGARFSTGGNAVSTGASNGTASP